MKHYNVIAIDLAKSVFQVCVVSYQGKVLFNKTMSRAKLLAYLVQQSKALVAMESCGGSSYWGRMASSFGHDVMIIPAKQVKPFRTGHKTDANDALAIAVACRAPNVLKARCLSIEEQGMQSVDRMRTLVNRQKLQLSNQLRGLLLEFGIVINKGESAFKTRLPEILEDAENDLPPVMRKSLYQLWQLYLRIYADYDELDKNVRRVAKQDHQCQRLTQLEGIGPIGAIQLKLQLVQDHFKNGRQASACIGLTPQQHSSGGKTNLGGIKRLPSEHPLRSTLFLGARSVVSRLKSRPAKTVKERWLKAIIDRRGSNRAAIALANKNVRTAYAMLKNDRDYSSTVITT